MKKYLLTVAAFFMLFFLSMVAAAQEGNSETKKPQNIDKAIKIKKKPKVELATCGQVEGLTRLRVTFDKTAKITDISIVKSSGCEAFDQNSVRAARGIKFEPAVRNGEAVTVSKPVEYQFRMY